MECQLAQTLMWSIVLSCMFAKVWGAWPTPPNPTTVTMYNLRPYNLTSDISDKDSADPMGDIFFYITDRLVVPYACRHSSKKRLPFFCRDFQKILQTPDQVYTKIQVQVDGSFGGCASGSDSCTQYADCNPMILPNKSVIWECDCDSKGPEIPSLASHLQTSRRPITSDYWKCKVHIASLCGNSRGLQCTSCAARHRTGALQSCSDDALGTVCSESYDTCRSALDASGCNKMGTTWEACIQCVAQDPKVLSANCSLQYASWLCSTPPKYCSATGKVAVKSRYCGDTDHTGLCSLCADGCAGIWDRWKSQVSRLGGLWYSTAKEGDCTNPRSKCAWKVLDKVKTVNATCANNNVHAVVEKRGQRCFSQCSQPSNTTSDCWILCFIETVIGRDPFNVSKVVSVPMTTSELTTPWLKAFESEDPAKGGCAALPPAPSSESLIV